MQTIFNELAAGHVFCDQAGLEQFVCFAENGPRPEKLNSLLFLSWSGFWEPMWYTSYGDDHDSHSQ